MLPRCRRKPPQGAGGKPPGTNVSLAATHIERSITFADGNHVEYDAVVWATGFTTDDSWVDVPDATDERGRASRP